MTDEQKFGTLVAGAAVFLLWLLNRKGLLHESVSAKIITPQGTILSDPATGAPQFDHRVAATIPPNEEFAVAPIDGDGAVTWSLRIPQRASCPTGYRLWRDAANGRYECIPF
jgi:hypothetical protein